MPDIIWKSSEGKETGFKSIKKIEGDVVEAKEIPLTFEGKTRSALEIHLVNAVVLESESPVTLENSEHTFAVPVSQTKDSFWLGAFVPGYEKLGVDLTPEVEGEIPKVIYQRTVFQRVKYAGTKGNWKNPADNFVPVEIKGRVKPVEEPAKQDPVATFKQLATGRTPKQVETSVRLVPALRGMNVEELVKRAGLNLTKDGVYEVA